MHSTSEDNYNFFHSSSRISVECAFGEIDLRWGILWRPLKFSLKHNLQVIDACLKLHNFIIDYRESKLEPTDLDKLDKIVFTTDYLNYLRYRPGYEFIGVDGGEDLVKKGGRPLKEENRSHLIGKNIRMALRNKVSSMGRKRPKINWYRQHNRFLN